MVNNKHYQIWKPDTQVLNLIDFKQVKMLQAMEGLTFTGDDEITYIATTISKLTCKMSFSHFSFDEQECPYYVSSSTYREDQLTFIGRFKDQLAMNSFQTFDIDLEDIGAESYINELGMSKSRTGFVMWLKRRPAIYVFKYFLPSFCIVLVSWVNFLIPPEAIPGGTGLLVTLFLVLTTLFGGMQVSL